MIEILAGALTSSTFGGFVGMIGSYFTKREERKTRRDAQEHEVRMGALRLKEMSAEQTHELSMADKQIERAQVEGSIALDVAEMGAFKAGLKEQAKTYGIVFVDAVKGLMRPVITVYLLGMATVLAVKLYTLVNGLASLPEAEAMALFSSVVNQVLFLASTSVTWWFGSRPSSVRK